MHTAFHEQFEAITLVSERWEETKAFYRDVFDAVWIYEDDVCAMVRVGPLIVNLLSRDAAYSLLQPRMPGRDDQQPRSLFTLRVADVDAVCRDLIARGVVFLDGPENRPWGRRTATFSDPSGQMWELAQVLDSGPA